MWSWVDFTAGALFGLVLLAPLIRWWRQGLEDSRR